MIKENPWINRILSAVFAIGMAVSGYFLNTTMGKIQEMEKRIYTIELSTASTSSNRFTTGDFVEAKKVIDSQIIAADRRIITLEEQTKQVKEILYEIRADLKDLKGEHYGKN